MFVDRVVLYVKGGDGGRGCCSFRREKYVPRGGPDGGDGGDGGNVIVCAMAGTDSLAEVVHQKHWRARNGGAGGSDNCHGRKADDLVITVPPGTLILDRDRGNILRDLTESGQQVVIARGGRGGRGNKAFATSTNRAPRQTQPGTPGEERWIVLELKVIADAGLIGLPNAGKSTLLSRLSQAQPEIADYPFTTKFPNLGIVTIGGDRVFVLADLPGLIEGAHSGHGLGHEFLRHVERTRVLVHLVEPLPLDGSDPLHNYRIIRRELELHGRELANRPEIVAVSKAELTGSAEVQARLESELGREVLAVSAVTGQGLARLVGAVVEQLDPGHRRGCFMTPAVVVDVGNSRIKWGRCVVGCVAESVSLPSDDSSTWQQQLARWQLAEPGNWIVTGVQPKRRDALADWLRKAGQRVAVLEQWRQLPLQVELDHPERVGIDRLFNAVAANSRRPEHVPAVLIDAGSAVTVDWLDENGAFCGGAILPGLRLMAQALHDYTALLPLVPLRDAPPPMPAGSTPVAMQTGIYWAVVGGIKVLIDSYSSRALTRPHVWLAGGDAALLAKSVSPEVLVWPEMTLEGIRLSAEALP